MEESLHLLVECSSSHNHLVEIASEEVGEPLTYFFIDQALCERQCQEALCAEGLELRENSGLHNFLHDERHADEDVGLHI